MEFELNKNNLMLNFARPDHQLEKWGRNQDRERN